MGIWVVPIFVEVLKNLTAKFLCILGFIHLLHIENRVFVKREL